MATLIIKDLPESIELDRVAMTSIVGGARTRTASTFVSMTPTSLPRPSRVFDYPPGFPNAHANDAAQDASRTPSPPASQTKK
ncbi:hypothetical protein [Pararobbsia silviterrae]|nr:hypothetical protein [Pararobbsia silviterrae]